MKKALLPVLATLFVACGDATMPDEVLPPPDPTATDSLLAGSTPEVDTVYGRIPAGLLEPDADVSIVGDTIFKDDTVAIGTLIETEETDSSSGDISADIVTPEQLEPGECAYEITITYDGDTILVITIRTLFCLDEEGVVVGGGGQTEYQVKLTCPASAKRGDPATCKLESEGPQSAISGIAWTAAASGHSATQDGGFVWSGRATKRVEITVSFEMYGETVSRSATVDVTNRGSTWEAESGVVAEGPGVTPCRDWNVGRDLWGQMTHVDCHPDLIAPDGHVVNGEGPWEGLYFVDLSSLAVRLKKILRPQLYDNGPEYTRPNSSNTFPTTTVPSGHTPTTWKQALIDACDDTFAADTTTLKAKQVNVDCGLKPNDFEAITSAVSDHEDEHVDSAMAVVKRMNIYEDLDPLAGTYDELKGKVDDKVELAGLALRVANRGVDHSGAEYGWFWRRVEQYNEWHWYKLVERD